MKLKRLLKWTTRGLLVVFLALTGWGVISYWTSTNECDEKVGALVHPMKAIRYCEYGVVTLDEVEKPVPKDNQVLIRVRAASLNSLDAYLVRDMWLVRLVAGLRKPRDTRLGRDLAGEVEAVGKNVTEFKPGDEVFGSVHGALAEYVCSSGRALAMKPANVTFEQAASIPHAGQTALQGLRAGNIQAGQKVLINGATGGVGTFGVQIAKAFGANVTAVCSTRNIELVRSIGADRVIDYTGEDFTKGGQQYELMLDMVGNRSLSECRRLLSSKGVYVAVGGQMGDWIGPLTAVFKVLLASQVGSQKMVPMLAKPNKEDLTTVGELIETGKLTPVIDRRYRLNEVPQAIRYLEQGHARGKVVIALEN
jgi:NADPH:quinone reductase-like Zn-dependent oxidoreductase